MPDFLILGWFQANTATTFLRDEAQFAVNSPNSERLLTRSIRAEVFA